MSNSCDKTPPPQTARHLRAPPPRPAPGRTSRNWAPFCRPSPDRHTAPPPRPVAPKLPLPPPPRPHHRAPTACAALTRARLTARLTVHLRAHRRAELPAQSPCGGPDPAPASSRRASNSPRQSGGSGCLLRRIGSFPHRYQPTTDAATPPNSPAATSAKMPARAASPPQKRRDHCRKRTSPPVRPGFAPDRTGFPFPPARGFRGRRHASLRPPTQPGSPPHRHDDALQSPPAGFDGRRCPRADHTAPAPARRRLAPASA